ncbi:MAG TPA: hypothetical protein VFW33_12240 [Gemmataceae bacterium]|nr:hypothetical protein [Gemmataceae bacterium]
MASPYQQQALRRKLIYIILIVVLFTAAGVYRKFVVEARADDLSLREQDLGEVDIGSSALELSLTGSRGFVVSALWYWTMDAFKKNRWNELELYVGAVTRLQPHFSSPWLYQSWNLSYNVAVEADQVKDKYFYVARGVQLLERGERMNHFHPDMRYSIGFYQQHKVMQSDETNVFRCLYQMSCMPYPERDAERFWTTDANGRRVIDVPLFEKFCADHPQFVRRLHDRLRCSRPEDVVAFLKDNKDIPSLYDDDPEKVRAAVAQGMRPPLKEVADRFPALPPPKKVREEELPAAPGAHLYDENELSYESELKDDFLAYDAARAWAAYAQDPIPAPDAEIPGKTTDIVDRTRQRKPRMTTQLFRNHPSRAQSYVAERLQDEGWFGPEGWLITGWFPRNRFHDGREAVVGTGVNWGEDSWHNAYEWWRRRGEESLLILPPQREAELRAKALAYVKAHNIATGVPPPSPEPAKGDPEYDGWHAANFMYELDYTRGLTRVMTFYHRAAVEMEPERTGQSLMEARRTMFQARQAVREGQRDKAAELFESKGGLERLRLVLERFPEFREDSNNQEAFYELEVRYIKLMMDKEGGNFKQVMAAGGLLGAGLPHGAGPLWPEVVQQTLMTEDTVLPKLPAPEFEPPERMRLEGADKDGHVLVSPTVTMQVKVRLGLAKPPPPPQMPHEAPRPQGGGVPLTPPPQ